MQHHGCPHSWIAGIPRRCRTQAYVLGSRFLREAQWTANISNQTLCPWQPQLQQGQTQQPPGNAELADPKWKGYLQVGGCTSGRSDEGRTSMVAGSAARLIREQR